MTDWTPQDLDRIARAEEVGLASRRKDGSLRTFITMWVVRVGDGVYVRSAAGVTNPWFRRAVASGTGRLRAGGVENDVDFELIDEDADAVLGAVTAAYHAKYDRYGPQIVGTVTGPDSSRTTLRLRAAD